MFRLNVRDNNDDV